MKILYFAWLRQKVGIGEETVDLPKDIETVAGLLDWLKDRNGQFADALSDTSVLRIAVNQEFATMETGVSGAEEVAIFPPMTGG